MAQFSKGTASFVFFFFSPKAWMANFLSKQISALRNRLNSVVFKSKLETALLTTLICIHMLCWESVTDYSVKNTSVKSGKNIEKLKKRKKKLSNFPASMFAINY